MFYNRLHILVKIVNSAKMQIKVFGQGENVSLFNKFPYGHILEFNNFQNDTLWNREGKYIYLRIKIIKGRLHLRNFLKVSRIEMM